MNDHEIGLGWRDTPETLAAREALAVRVGQQQERIARGRPELEGRTARGQHQKQLLGAFGVLRIDSAAATPARLGPFRDGWAHHVACRLSNGRPCPFADHAPDVRGIAVKLFTPSGFETDLVMTNEGGRSHARNALQFMDIADLLVDAQLAHGAAQVVRDLSHDLLTGRLGPVEAVRVAAVLGKETLLHRVESMTTEHFWGSVVAVEGRAVKYSLHPVAGAEPGTRGDSRAPNYLRDDLLARLAEGPLEYQLGVQLYIDEETTPVNDASIAWRAPVLALGTLAIVQVPREADERLVDRMAFNPGNGFEPLGITHARKVAYAASARNRGALTTEEIRRHFRSGALL